jgi:O-acetyl-ADP-ribose deacetylase (regulator of RNase III)
VWEGGASGEPALLASCYRRSLELARDHGLRSVAFPGISTGAYGYPIEEAARVSVGTIRAFLAANALPERVVLCAFGSAAHAALDAAMRETPEA